MALPHATGAPSMGYVGVDVVDITRHRAVRRSRDQRFLDRVFTAREQERIRTAADPEVEIWILWAAKEASFKVLTKLEGEPPVFRHRSFETADEPGEPPRTLTFGSRSVQLGVHADAHRVMVHAWDDPSSLVMASHLTVERAAHSLAVGEPLERWKARRFSPEELDAVHGVSSALVRLLARRDASALLRLPEERLSIVCPPGPTGLRPPYLYLDGAPLPGVDISLSHDGAHLAWAVRIPWSP